MRPHLSFKPSQTFSHSILKTITLPIAAIGLGGFFFGGAANGFEPGAYDDEALRLLREMSAAIPLRTTSIAKIAPAFAVEKHAGLDWTQAVAEADSRFGQRQPERAAFLRKYLGKGSLETKLEELQLPLSGMSAGTGSGRSRGFIFGPTEKPVATITVWIAQGQLIGEPTLGLTTVNIEGIIYRDLVFDLSDQLISANRQMPGNAEGATITVGQNTSGTGGVSYFWAQISAPGGASESISYTPELVIQARRVQAPASSDFREVYKGKRRGQALNRTSSPGFHAAAADSVPDPLVPVSERGVESRRSKVRLQSLLDRG